MNIKEKTINTQRNRFIDILKGICIIFVVVTHFSWSDQERLKYLFPFWIDMAVPMFMIISGYVSSFSYKKNQINCIEKAYCLKNTLNKMIRYTVPFLLVFIIEELLNIRAGNISLSLHGIFGAVMYFLVGGCGPGGYYYPIMMQFIFVFPIIYFIVNKYQFKGVVICGLLNALFELLQRAYGMNESCYYYLIFRYVLLIAFGCFIALFNDYKFKKILACVSCIVGCSFIIAVCYLQYKPRIIIYWTRTSFVGCLFIIPIAGFIIRKFRNARCTILEIIGKSSYNIFLIQKVWYKFISSNLAEIISNKFLHLIANVIICIIIGVIFYYIEMPITKRITSLAYKILDKYNHSKMYEYIDADSR